MERPRDLALAMTNGFPREDPADPDSPLVPELTLEVVTAPGERLWVWSTAVAAGDVEARLEIDGVVAAIQRAPAGPIAQSSVHLLEPGSHTLVLRFDGPVFPDHRFGRPRLTADNRPQWDPWAEGDWDVVQDILRG